MRCPHWIAFSASISWIDSQEGCDSLRIEIVAKETKQQGTLVNFASCSRIVRRNGITHGDLDCMPTASSNRSAYRVWLVPISRSQ